MLKFKVVNESVKKTDRHDAQTIAEFLEKDMFPEAKLYSRRSEELRRILSSMVTEDRVVELITSIPGAGLITATSIRAYIDDIERFKSFKQLSAYAGLVPRVQCSDTTEHYGRITKRGPEPLRTVMVQLVLGMIRSRRTAEYRIMKRYAVMKGHKGSGKSIIATARKLSKIIWYMLKNNTPFDPFRITDPHIVQTARDMLAAADDAA